ncbi:cytochrome c biogenesis protein ResB [Pelosinus sp. UFO1]|uniref:cytochrome c biogenesis protein ResB n=1 Tax=Pelosinus sp. UFO1 TaxID=484770 RepID=UPI0004D0F43E|nr:cytochrome c biogenesis protein ResB [Pelosinus sp. UFO1]AIF53587.1 ResB family protein [Pelosinus sp. UFO1]
MAEKDVALQGEAHKQSKLFLKAMKVCSSIKVGMVLLLLLIGASMAGTIISVKGYDVYHSLGFRILLLLVCSAIFLRSVWQFSILYSSKARTRLSSWGSLLVHVAILLIVMGALYGNQYGFNEEINLPVGRTYEINNAKYGINDSFTLQLQNFETRYNPDRSVSDWVSYIIILGEGEEAAAQEIKVNHPYTYHGVSIYQSSFGMAMRTQYLSNGGAVLQEASLEEGNAMVIEEQPGMMIRFIRYIPSPTPQVLYIVYKEGREYDWGSLPLGSSKSIGNAMGMVSFKEAQPFSGLLIKRDPGIPLVWTGFVLLAFGFFVSLYKKDNTVFEPQRHNTTNVVHKGEKEKII